jgi:two-component system chemotaxis response regulator CheY
MAKTIMLVDDSATIRMSVRTNLEVAGFVVETAEDGVKALAQLEEGLKPDLIITDINMPNMDGLTLIKKIRELASFRFLPILTLTTEGQASKREQGKKMGVTGWLVKPIGGGDLLRIIKQVLPGA